MMQQPGLPFDPTSLSVQPNQYRTDSPPCVPQGIIVVNQLQHLIVPACALVANEATSTCQAHSGRTFLFNQLAANGYNNRDFGMAVGTALDLLLLGLVRNQYRTPEEGLQDAVRKAMTFVSALNFQKYPVLQQYVSPDIWNSAVQVLNQMPQMANDVAQAKNSLQQPQNNFNMGGGMSNNTGVNNYPQQNVWRGNPQQQYPQQGGYPQQAQHYPGTQAVASSLFGSGHVAAIQPNQTGPVGVDGDRYAYLRKTVEPVNQVQAKPIYNKGHNSSNTFVKEPEKAGLVWTSSPAQPYIMTIDPRTQRLGLKEMVWNDNNTYVISYPITLTETEIMDRKQHSIGLVAEAIIARPALNNVPRTQALETAVDKLINKRSLGVLSLSMIDELKAKKQTTVVNESFLEAAIFAGRVNMHKAAIEDETADIAFQTTAIITEPVLTAEDATDFIERLASCTSYQRIVDTLTTGLIDPSTANLSAKIDKVFTKQVNSMLRNTMSISDKIDSFVSDAVPLIDHLSKKFGDQMTKAYLSQQSTFTASFFDVPHLMTEDMVEAISTKLNLDIGDDSALPVGFITQRNTLTYLDVHSSEIGIEPNAKYGSSILQSNHPLLYQLIKNIFDQDEALAYKAAHHLLITADNVIFEFHKGLLGTDFYTVSEYK